MARKDAVGVATVLCTALAVVLHNIPGHRASHAGPVADAGGAITSALSVTTVAFYDVNVVPMDRDVVFHHQVVIVQDGEIARIGDVGVLETPRGARVVEGGGTRYLAPGLTDAHVHLGAHPEALLPLFLANGVTTVFNLEGEARHLELRDRIGQGELPGPTIYTAGPFADERSVRTPADAARLVRDQHARGYDFVKLHGDLSAEAFQALTRTGREEGIAVLGHAPRNLPFSAVLGNGQVDVAHAEELIYTQFMTLDSTGLPGTAEAMAASGTWLTPGLATFENIASQWGAPAALDSVFMRPGARFLPSSMRRAWVGSREYVGRDPAGRQRIEQMLAFHGPIIRSMYHAHVPLLAGTDAGLSGMVPGFSLADEITELAAVGVPRYDALAAATRNAGRFVREHVDPAARFGTIAAGARADLVLLDGDPRTDLSVLRRPAGVMVRGRWYDRGELDRMLNQVPAGR